MSADYSQLTIHVSKPKGKLAQLLLDKGVEIKPIMEDEGNVDRYILSSRLAIDRRNGSSFLSGIQDKTLFTTAIYLREHFEIPILILEGEVDYAYTAFNPQAARGALAAMTTVYGISVLSTPNLEETTALILMLAQQEQVGVPEISLIPKRKAVDLPDLQRRIVEMLPGSGRVLARQLLQHFGSIQRIVKANPKELRQVPGIGPQKAAHIHQILHSEYEAVDTEKQIEDIVETNPELLFKTDVKLIARQHVLLSDEKDRQVIDLVFFNSHRNALILVELKRGRLTFDHERQLSGYLQEAHRSQLLRAYLEGGSKIMGILATIDHCEYKPKSDQISVRVIDKTAVINLIKELRAERLSTASKG